MSPSSSASLSKLEQLFTVSRSFSQAEDMDSLLNLVIHTTLELTNCRFCSILLFEQETNTLKFAACNPEHQSRLHQLRVPLERSLSGTTYKSGKSTIVQDAANDPRLLIGPKEEFGFSCQTALLVPLIYRGEPIGILEAIEKQSNLQFSSNDVEILETLAYQVAASILGHLLYDEIKHAYDEVQALEKLKSNFIAIASHELRTPLGLILGHATYMDEIIQDPELKSQLEVIIRSANRLKSILEDLSNVNNYQSGVTRFRRRRICVNELINSVAQNFHSLAEEKHLRLITQAPKDELILEGDEEKITIALNNLLKNALTFTDTGGSVLIRAEKISTYIQITVVDNGIGIPVSDLPHIFDRFYQVQSHLIRRHGGMGLGLSVAKAMVDLHKGQIWVESELGKGSKFTLLLPMQSTTNPLGKVSAFAEK